ncbi:MAG: hypothetical protein RIS64_4249 [Bacteroidota bacterium]|jgi:hypothetical protein
MKKLLFINLLCLLYLPIQAQKPVLSTEAAFRQQFGSSEISIGYARPSARGRQIFGGVVPFDSLWRTGANDCTTLKFKADVIIGDKKMPAGKYALFTIPNKDEWTIILNADSALHGTRGYNMSRDLHRFKVKPVKSERFYETFTIEINDFTPQGAAFLNLIWENTVIKILLESPISEQTAESKPIVTPEPKVAQTVPAAPVEIQKADLKVQFAPIFATYYDLKNALVADNAKLAAEKGRFLKKALSDLDTKNWTIQQRNVYDAKAKKMEVDAEHIGDNANKIDHQREHFENLSKNLFEIAKSLKINTEPVYWQFCPMANEGKGAYWLSKENKVKNPYFGKSMLTCGSVKETLK